MDHFIYEIPNVIEAMRIKGIYKTEESNFYFGGFEEILRAVEATGKQPMFLKNAGQYARIFEKPTE